MALEKLEEKYVFEYNFTFFFSDLVPPYNLIFGFGLLNGWLSIIFDTSASDCHISLHLLHHRFWNRISRHGLKTTLFAHSMVYLEQKTRQGLKLRKCIYIQGQKCYLSLLIMVKSRAYLLDVCLVRRKKCRIW
jgi:hypothetical protein